MLARFYIVIDDNHPDLHQDMDDEGMQDFVIYKSSGEGVLYHSEMSRIKIIYNTHTGEVKLVDADEKVGINFDYSNAFLGQRKLVELAIRRLVKMELLGELHQMNDSAISDIIRQNHKPDPATGRLCSNTSEIALDMTLVKIIKLGYVDHTEGFSLWRWLGLSRKNQTRTQRAIYSAFEDFKKECDCRSEVLDHFKSRRAIQRFKEFVQKYL